MAGLIAAGVALLTLVVGMWVYVKVAERTKRLWVGALAGVLAFVAMIFVIAPASGALDRIACQNAHDYAACISPDTDY
uniref:hypothetical protein n=1 Tax=Sphingomonas bacterium TaxID=1895847 RepID=UPI002630D53E|nr:hypothetical protein [Sphingomonas bacterium]